MPFYEYQCKNCGHDLEAMQKVGDTPLKKCPHCGKSQLQRLISAPVFRLKGSGWYETDFKGDADKQRNLADRPDKDTPKEAADSKDAKDSKDGKDGKDSESKPKEGAEAKGVEAKKDSAGATGNAGDKSSGKESTDKSGAKPGKPAASKSAPKRSVKKRRAKMPPSKAWR